MSRFPRNKERISKQEETTAQKNESKIDEEEVLVKSRACGVECGSVLDSALGTNCCPRGVLKSSKKKMDGWGYIFWRRMKLLQRKHFMVSRFSRLHSEERKHEIALFTSLDKEFLPGCSAPLLSSLSASLPSWVLQNIRTSTRATMRVATLKHAQDALKGVVRISILSEDVLLYVFFLWIPFSCCCCCCWCWCWCCW